MKPLTALRADALRRLISVIDTVGASQVAHVALHNPEPASILNGRRFLYDTALTSSHGDSACASCHIFGDFDSLAWDLGNPDDTVLNNPGPFRPRPDRRPGFPSDERPHDDAEPARDGEPSGRCTGAATAPVGTTLRIPNPTAVRSTKTPRSRSSTRPSRACSGAAAAHDRQMQAFTDFILQVTYPPNPIRRSTTY
jgi:hypothetical protein